MMDIVRNGPQIPDMQHRLHNLAAALSRVHRRSADISPLPPLPDTPQRAPASYASAAQRARYVTSAGGAERRSDTNDAGQRAPNIQRPPTAPLSPLGVITAGGGVSSPARVGPYAAYSGRTRRGTVGG